MAHAFLGLGSNVGDRQAHLQQAIQRMGQLPASRLTQVSTIREYPAIGGPPQGPYLNAVAELTTRLAPRKLLDHLHAIEAVLGRIRAGAGRWGPRTIDLDLLLYGPLILREPEITLPHPRLHERRFVLEPLAEIAPSAYHPVLRRTAATLLMQLQAAAARPRASRQLGASVTGMVPTVKGLGPPQPVAAQAARARGRAAARRARPSTAASPSPAGAT